MPDNSLRKITRSIKFISRPVSQMGKLIGGKYTIKDTIPVMTSLENLFLHLLMPRVKMHITKKHLAVKMFMPR